LCCYALQQRGAHKQAQILMGLVWANTLQQYGATIHDRPGKLQAHSSETVYHSTFSIENTPLVTLNACGIMQRLAGCCAPGAWLLLLCTRWTGRRAACRHPVAQQVSQVQGQLRHFAWWF
jgi:hypothetical protein